MRTAGRVGLSVLLLLATAPPDEAQSRNPSVQERGKQQPSVVPTRQLITPAGVHTAFDEKVYAVAFGRSSEEVWALLGRNWVRHGSNGRLLRLDWRKNRITFERDVNGSVGLQGLVFDPVSRHLLATAAVEDGAGSASAEVGVPAVRESAFVLNASTAQRLSGSLAVARKKNRLGYRPVVVPLTFGNALDVLDTESDELKRSIPSGIAPFAAVFTEDGTVAYASNWG